MPFSLCSGFFRSFFLPGEFCLEGFDPLPAFFAALDALNGFGDLDDCMIYIAENYAWNANSDGAKLLMELLERKFA